MFSAESNSGISVSRRRSDALALVFALLFPSALTYVYFDLLADQCPAVQQTVYTVGKAVQFLFPIAWVVYTSGMRRPWARRTARGLLLGILFGLVVLTAMLVLYHGWLKPAGLLEEPGRQIRAKILGLGIDSFWKYAALGVFYSVCHSFLEEYYWRWFVYGRMRRHTSWSVAMLVSSLGFMAHHVILLKTYFGWASPATYFFSLSVAVGGAVWAWLYERSGSLGGPWLSHLLVDAGIFLIGFDLARGLLAP